MDGMERKVADMKERKAVLSEGGGKARTSLQHERGKQTARERIDQLVDVGSFREINGFVTQRPSGTAADEVPMSEGVVTGTAKVEGCDVCVFAQDFTVSGGTLGERHAFKIARVMDLAADTGMPIIGLNDSGGARIQEGVLALDGYGQLFERNVRYSGKVPQISVMMGPCAGGAVYSPALTDFVFMVEKTAQMFITGPKVVKAATGSECTPEQLGSAKLHAEKSGNAHFTSESEEAVFVQVRRLLSFLSRKKDTGTRQKKQSPELLTVVPGDRKRVYDVREVIIRILDQADFMEVQPLFGANIVIGFGRMDGQTVGVVANNPKVRAGALDTDASVKAARFIRFCDCFHIPLLTFVDVSGYLPSMQQQTHGIIRHGAKLLYAYAEATVPKITVILRKAYGGAYVAMNSKAIGADFVFAWPTAEIAVMGPEGAVEVLFAEELQNGRDPEKLKHERIREYQEKHTNPYNAAASGMVDDIIDPQETRCRLLTTLELLRTKSKNQAPHGNIPL